MRSLADQVSSSLRELSNLLHAHGVDRYMNLASASVYSGLSKRSLTRYIHSPRNPLPAFKIGGKWLIKRSEFDRWVEQYRNPPEIDLDEIIRKVLGPRNTRSSRRKKRGLILNDDHTGGRGDRLEAIPNGVAANGDPSGGGLPR